jgi:hypothetical protein
MRTLTEKYNGVLKGLFSKDQFLRDARMEQSQLITQHNSYSDAINILKGKGLISETISNEVQIQGQDGIKYMDSANTLLQALKPTFQNAEIVFAGRNNNLARVTYHTENPGGEGITTVNCGETSVSEKPFFHQEVDETGDTNTVGFDTIEELIQYCKSGEEMFEKKLTPAEKKGKEKILKGLKKSMGKTPMAYAIATKKAKELYEGPAEVDKAYYDTVAFIAKHAKSLNDDDAYQFHEQLKSFFNRMLENVNEESSAEVKKGDILKHKSSGVEVEVTAISHKENGEARLYRGKITDAGKITGLETAGKIYQIRPTLVGTTWFVKDKEQLSESPQEVEEQDIHLAKQIARAMSREDGVTKYVVEREKVVITYAVVNQPEAGSTIAAYENGAPIAGLNEAKDEYTKIESPKPELPLDVLHHGIRFELDKKEIGNTPTEEEYMKAFKAATKNLEKDLLHYKKEEGATEAPVSKKEEMVKMKLKENFKTIIRNILSESASPKKPFNIKGEIL